MRTQFSLFRFIHRLSLAPRRVLMPLIMAACVSIGVFAISEISNAHLRATDDEIRVYREMLKTLAEYRGLLVQAETGQLGFLLNQQEAYLNPLVDSLISIPQTQEKLRDLVTDRKDWRDKLAQINLDSRNVFIQMEDTVELVKAGEIELARLKVEKENHRAQVDSVRAQLRQFEDEIQVRLSERLDAWWIGLTLARIGIGVIVCLSLLFLAALTRLLIDHLEQREDHRLALEAQAEELERKVQERTDELSSLSTYLQDSIENSKAQLARDLHDEFGAILTSAKIDASWIEGRLQRDPEASERVARLNKVLDEAIDLKRRVIENLRPSLLDHLGLQAALEWYVTETCEQAGLECSLQIFDEEEIVPANIAISLYRIVQEGLNNAIKYARCKHISLALSRSSTGYRLFLADDGIGIPHFRSDRLSHGIAGMRQRALSLKGLFTIRTSPGEGTIVDVFVPYPQAKPLEVPQSVKAD